MSDVDPSLEAPGRASAVAAAGAALLLEQIAETDAVLESCPALRLVPYPDMLAYLEGNSWRPTRGYAAEGFDYFWHPDDTSDNAHIMGTALDRSNFRPDALPYGNAEFVNDLARVHGRPAFAVLCDLLALTPVAKAARAKPEPASGDSRFTNRESSASDLGSRIRARLDDFGPDARLQLARAALLTVLEDHAPEPIGAVLGPEPLFYCRECSRGYNQESYPCPTLQAIARALRIEVDGD